MRFLLPALSVLAGCGSPCDKLNHDLVKFWGDCEVDLPSELDDGGDGECAIDGGDAACTTECYNIAGCGAIDGSDDDAAFMLADCTAGC